mgnify:FL=1
MQELNDCQIKTYSSADRTQLQEFFDSVWTPPPLEKSQNWFEWKFRDDPNSGQSDTPLLIAWLGEKVVGIIVLVPTPLWIRGQIFHVAWGRDFFVNPEYRRHKIGIQLIHAWGQHFQAALGSGQSQIMRNLQLNHNWVEIAKIRQYEKLYWDKRLLKRSFAEGIIKVCKRFLAMLYAQLKSFYRADEVDGSITHSSSFLPEVDALWGYCRSEYDYICQRDFDTLQWRFTKHPYYKYIVSQFVDRRGHYRGYLVTRQEGETCWLIDILTRKDDNDARLALISDVEEYYRNNGVNKFTSRSVCVFLENSLIKRGYVATTFEQFFCVKVGKEFQAGGAGQWYVTSMDSDLDR